MPRPLLALAPLLAIACSPSPTPTTVDDGAIRSTTPPATSAAAPSADIPANPSCGKEENVHGQGHNAAARECFWNAYQTNKPAELVIVVYTIEGDPITHALLMRSPSSIEVVRDSKDRFGSPGVTRSTCTAMQRKQDDRGTTIFSLTGCTGDRSEVTNL
ncbi:DUF4362 domain-containing protein [Polyangium aurulentum]|uniref:DUF4362 domain-containing protein n=1 Tax=Polyangium aurulentum TaxID=2567896 RepID=UPI0010AE817A|nr:DUF4362 domain-containing protein [Polyangium aurulentum]UQA59277.1 DUF4362 domain-containing protein [Polyangium aurulentum]